MPCILQHLIREHNHDKILSHRPFWFICSLTPITQNVYFCGTTCGYRFYILCFPQSCLRGMFFPTDHFIGEPSMYPCIAIGHASHRNEVFISFIILCHIITLHQRCIRACIWCSLNLVYKGWFFHSKDQHTLYRLSYFYPIPKHAYNFIWEPCIPVSPLDTRHIAMRFYIFVILCPEKWYFVAC